ncbi:MAG: S-methyl-5'-thioadenosine phosphorylase [Thermomicrobiales bacterium]
MADEISIAVIGGSGLYRMPDLTEPERRVIETPFGAPSDAITIGTLAGRRVAFLPRHGTGHRIPPSLVPARANFYALKSLGVRAVISVSAVGSLREAIAPLHLVVPDQIVDRTTNRPRTFFDREGLVGHVSLAEPFCPSLRGLLIAGARETGATVHAGGTYICIEGPRFSTKAESLLYRQWGLDIIGMTAMPEAQLAREAELCYAVLALATDYDVWHESEAPVSVELVMQNLTRNVATAQDVIRRIVPRIALNRDDACTHALAGALMTEPTRVPADVRARLGVIVDNYLPKP